MRISLVSITHTPPVCLIVLDMLMPLFAKPKLEYLLLCQAFMSYEEGFFLLAGDMTC